MDSRPPPTATRRIPQKKPEKLDEATLARHREAQKAAIASARLGEKEPGGSLGSGARVSLSILAGLALGAAGLWMYLESTQAVAAPSEVFAPHREALQPSPVPAEPPSPPTEPPALAGSAVAEGGGAPVAGEPGGSAPTSEASVQGAVTIIPSHAGVLLDGERIEGHGGVLQLEGEVGSRHNVVMTVGREMKSFFVTMTEEGPSPRSLFFMPESATPPPAPEPAPQPPTPPPAPPGDAASALPSVSPPPASPPPAPPPDDPYR